MLLPCKCTLKKPSSFTTYLLAPVHSQQWLRYICSVLKYGLGCHFFCGSITLTVVVARCCLLPTKTRHKNFHSNQSEWGTLDYQFLSVFHFPCVSQPWFLALQQNLTLVKLCNYRVLWIGNVRSGFVPSSQNVPLKCRSHSHSKLSTSPRQLPSFWHTTSAQLSTTSDVHKTQGLVAMLE